MHIETMTVEQTVEALREFGMRINAEKLRNGIRQGVYPFGDCVRMEKQDSFDIYAELFKSWAAERAAE